MASPAAQAQPQPAESPWPQRAVNWIVPFPPGGAMDVMARTLADELRRALGQPFVIENRAGAGGNIGAEYVAGQRPDGHTLMITSIGMATNAHLYAKLGYDPLRDFAPVTLLAVVPNVLVINAANARLTSVESLVAAARAAPGRLTYASAGNGTSIHLAGASFARLAGVDIVHVPYRGSSPAVADLLGGQVDMMFDSITSARPHLESGKLRALGLTTTRRSTALPAVPPLADAGLPGYEVSPWFGIFVPAATPAAVIDRIHRAVAEAMALPAVRERFAAIGAEPIVSSPAELGEHLKRESERWGTVIREAGIKLD